METLKGFSALIAGLSGNAGGTTARTTRGTVVFGKRKTHTSGVSDPHTPWRRIMAVMERSWEELGPAGRAAWLNGCPVPGLSGRDYFGRTNYWQVALHDGYLAAPTGEDLRVAPRAARPGLVPLAPALKDALCLDWVESSLPSLTQSVQYAEGWAWDLDKEDAWEAAWANRYLSPWKDGGPLAARNFGVLNAPAPMLWYAYARSQILRVAFDVSADVFAYLSAAPWRLDNMVFPGCFFGSYQIGGSVFSAGPTRVVDLGQMVRLRKGRVEIVATTADGWAAPPCPSEPFRETGWSAEISPLFWKLRQRLPTV
jgi:hypothetical protein